MKNKIAVTAIAIVFILTGAACAGSETVTEEAGKAETRPAFSNIGFMKNPPKELTEKFPMCDSFLRVDWINPDKKIGYSHYEALVRGKRKTVWALITLDDEAPCYSWDVYQFVRQRRQDEIFEMIRHGDIVNYLSVMILKYRGESVKIFPLLQTRDSLADNRITICIPYPDKQRVWIVEGKGVGRALTEEQKKELYSKINKSVSRFTDEWFNSLWILDINFDGKEDYVSRVSFLLSSSNDLISAESIHKSSISPYFELTFPPTGRSCRVGWLGNSPITTDGRSYYFNNQCNLRNLISDSEKD